MASDVLMSANYGCAHMGLAIDLYYQPASLYGMSTIGARIRSFRNALGLKQVDLASRVGIDQSTLSDIERGAGFGAEILMRLSKGLDLSAEHLMLGHDSRTWPFAKIDIRRFMALGEADRAYAEGRLAAAIEECEHQPRPHIEAAARSALAEEQQHQATKRKKKASPPC